MSWVRRWLEDEQAHNDRIFPDTRGGRIDVGGSGVGAAWRPEARGAWPLEVVWLPRGQARWYGPVRERLGAALGVSFPGGRVPLFLHPQPPRALRRVRARHDAATLADVRVTPTSSFRSLLAWPGPRGRAPVALKLSLGAVVGGTRRALDERELVSGLVVTRLLETIPRGERRRLGLDWFAETAGVVHAESGTGWLLRELPASLRGSGGLVPIFALVAGSARAPLLATMIESAGGAPEEFVAERLLRPYVRVLAHLLFEEGIAVEGHAQNVLVETDAGGALTGRVILRDLSDASVSLPLRVARGKPLPPLPRPRGTGVCPFPLAAAAADHTIPRARAPLQRARATVEHYGLRSFLAVVNDAMERAVPGYDRRAVEDAYLTAWQAEAARRLGVTPLFRAAPRGLATDEALTLFFRHADWGRAGLRRAASLPGDARPLLVERRVRRRRGARYDRVGSAWGDLYLEDGLPAFFRPAR